METLKCRINLKFTNDIACYLTPLALTSLERVVKSFSAYKVNPNHLITKMQENSKAAFAQESLIDVISKTQVSMNIPRILLCSLQCGLAEGDKVANVFTSTLASPEEFMALSLFTICVQSVQTQVIDSQNRSAAIFMIDKIESQFCRLYETPPTNKLDEHSSSNHTTVRTKAIKLSCISGNNSKTSIRCFDRSVSAGNEPQRSVTTFILIFGM